MGMTALTDTALDEQLSTALRVSGHRVTMPRLLVHRHVRRAERHLTPEQVHSDLAPQHPGLSPATIYGTLDLLEELGFLRRVSTPRGNTVYDLRVEPHHHVLCRRCGRIDDVEAPVDSAAAERAAGAAGFVVDHGMLQLTGLCPDCANGPVATSPSGPRDHAA